MSAAAPIQVPMPIDAPAFRLTDIRPAGRDQLADRVERILADRHTEQDHGAAVRRLAKVRPDLDRHSIESFIAAILWHAQEVQLAWHGPLSVLDEKIDGYEVCLDGFTRPRVRAS